MSNKCVVISGASTGIGYALALEFDQRGFHVYAGVRRAEDGDRLRQAGSERMKPVTLEVTQDASVDAVVERVRADGLYTDSLIVISNAGVMYPSPIEGMPMRNTEKTFQVNYFGVVRLSKAFVPLLREARHGRVAIIGSVGGRVAQPLLADYTASKAAVRSFSRSLRMELAAWNIAVVLIEPGAVTSKLMERGLGTFESDWNTIDPQIAENWAPVMERVQSITKNFSHMLPADKAATRIADAIVRRSPRREVLIGKDAQALNILQRMLPQTLFEKIVSRIYQLNWLPKRGGR